MPHDQQFLIYQEFDEFDDKFCDLKSTFATVQYSNQEIQEITKLQKNNL